MSRQLDKKIEDRSRKLKDAAVLALYGGLEDAVGHAGGALTGFSVTVGDYECLMVLKAVFPGGKQVAFVGASGLPEVFVKASREAARDELRWKEDQWANDRT